MEFFAKNFTISFSGFYLVLFIFLEAVLVVISLLYTANFLHKKLNHRAIVKTGFLGKKLMSLVILFSMLSVILLGRYLYQNQINYSSEAELQVDLDIKFKISEVDQLSNKKIVYFNVIPIIDNRKWGNNDTFDIIWTIEPGEKIKSLGAETINKFEYSRSEEKPSNIKVDLLSGNYKIRVLVTFDKKAFEKEIDVVI